MPILNSSARHRESGAVLVEAVIVTPLIIILIFGLLEFGLLFRDYLTIANVTRSGARVVSAQGQQAAADYNALQAMKASGAALSAGTIDRIVIFKADAPNGAIPPPCVNGPSSNAHSCNVYTGAQLNALPSSYGPPFGPGGLDWSWKPADRKDKLNPPGGPPDYVGVYIRVRHDYVTRFFGTSRNLADTTVMRVEPTG